MDQALTVPPSPVDLPECRVGRVSIRHAWRQAGETLCVITDREAIFTGRRPAAMTLKRPLRVHELEEDSHGTWMTDHPVELVQMQRFVEHASGDVLIGGLGLGVLARWVAANKNVGRVVVVERSRDVARLIQKHQPLPSNVHVEVADLYQYLLNVRQRPRPFYTALLDTWQGTGERTWMSEVAPLKRIIGNRWGINALIRTHCWAEDIMIGQLALSLAHQLAIAPETIDRMPAGYRAWRRGNLDRWPSAFVDTNAPDAEAWFKMIKLERDRSVRARLRFFFGHIGTAQWERRHGMFDNAAWRKHT